MERNKGKHKYPATSIRLETSFRNEVDDFAEKLKMTRTELMIAALKLYMELNSND
jgi:predicted transcriptional regulator